MTNALSFSSIRKNIVVLTVVTALFFGMFAHAPQAKAQSLSDLQEQIHQLLQVVAQLQAQLAEIRGTASESVQSPVCVELTRSMFLGSNDASTAGQVGKLQQFLKNTGDYTYGEITGYFGPATQAAVQKWQAKNGVVSSGSPETTGFGLVGSQTRVAMSKGCKASNQSLNNIHTDIVFTTLVTGDDLSITVGVTNVDWDSEYRYVVHFGDGTSQLVKRITETEAEAVLRHEYEDPGKYTISLTYTNWGSTNPNNDTYGLEAMRNVNHWRNALVAKKTIEIESDDVKCQIVVSDDKVSTHENVEIFWSTNANNPTLVQPGKGEYSVKNSDALTVTFGAAGTYTFKIKSPKEGTLCTNEVEVVEKQDEDSNQQHALEQMIENVFSQLAISSSKTSPTDADLIEQLANLIEALDSDRKEEFQDELREAIDDVDENDEDSSLGTYKGYMNGNLFITTKNITEDYALENCKLNANNNSSKEVYCTWNDELIFNSNDAASVPLSSMAIGVGAYEGTYPSGVRHSYGYHPQGEIDVYIGENGHASESLTLVLTSYEPVKWNISGPGIDAIKNVFASGYYDQEVQGLSVPVTMKSYENGDSDYFYAYKNTGNDFEELHEYIQDTYETKFQMFEGKYTQDEVKFIYWKG